MNRIAITRTQYNSTKYAFIMLDQDRVLDDFELFDDSNTSILDNIYIGRVENIVPNINSAFIKIGEKQNCYLSLDNARFPVYVKKNSKKEGLAIGDEIIVQVIKDAVKTKDPVVTCNISYHGKHCILTTGNKTIGVSKKIEPGFSRQISDKIKSVFNKLPYGIVIRTNAATLKIDEILTDITETATAFNNILTRGLHGTIYTKLFSAEPAYIMKLKATDMTSIDSVITDIDEVHKTLVEYYSDSPYRDKIVKYDDSDIKLSTLYNLNGQIEKLINSRIWLDSGANIIIEQLETLTVIDVNTGKNISKKPNTILEVNIEAAIEIARQLRLRNISGMIIIDFINMASEEDKKELINALKKEIQKDSVRCTFIDITKLGLVELTRKKVRKSLKDSL